MIRLLGIDNAHGLPRRILFDHQHRFRRTEEMVPYAYQGADVLIGDFLTLLNVPFAKKALNSVSTTERLSWRTKMAKKSLNDLRAEMLAVARGERAPAPLPAREVLGILASAEYRELLQIIHADRPESVSQLAELSGRAQPNVSRSLQQLAKHGLIELVRNGREVRPKPIAATVSISLADDTYQTTPLLLAAE